MIMSQSTKYKVVGPSAWFSFLWTESVLGWAGQVATGPSYTDWTTDSQRDVIIRCHSIQHTPHRGKQLGGMRWRIDDAIVSFPTHPGIIAFNPRRKTKKREGEKKESSSDGGCCNDVDDDDEEDGGSIIQNRVGEWWMIFYDVRPLFVLMMINTRCCQRSPSFVALRKY